MFAYVPARGGSKRVPGKNIRPLGGLPVIGHTLQTLSKLDFLDAVFVSTDDFEIAAVAQRFGARWLGPRDALLSDDKAGFIDLIHKDLPRHAEVVGGDRDVLFVLALAALVPPDVFSAARVQFLRNRPKLLMSVVPCAKSPYWALVANPSGYLTPLFPDWVYVNSQELPPAFHDAGLFYMFDWTVMQAFDSHKDMPGVAPFIVDSWYAIDVDTEADWTVLEERFERHAQIGEGGSV